MDETAITGVAADPVATWVWLATIAGILGLFIFDFFTHVRKPHEPTFREAGAWSIFYVTLALLFGAGVWHFWDRQHGIEYFAGFITEKSLSVDNLFVFVIIMRSFAVPRAFQQKALLIGIVMALAMRGIFIALGAAAIERFSWVFYIFGLFLIYTAYKLAKESMTTVKSTEEAYEPNAVVLYVQRHLPTVPDFRGNALTVIENGKAVFHADVHRHPCAWHDGLAFRARLYPGDLRPHGCSLHCLRRQCLRAARASATLLPAWGAAGSARLSGYRTVADLGLHRRKLIIHAMEANTLSFVNGGQL